MSCPPRPPNLDNFKNLSKWRQYIRGLQRIKSVWVKRMEMIIGPPNQAWEDRMVQPKRWSRGDLTILAEEQLKSGDQFLQEQKRKGGPEAAA